MKAYGGVEVQLQSFFDIGIRYRLVISFTPRSLYPQEKSPGSLWIVGWVGLSRSGRGGEEKNSQPPPGIEP
jgi:hypothetical protein